MPTDSSKSDVAKSTVKSTNPFAASEQSSISRRTKLGMLARVLTLLWLAVAGLGVIAVRVMASEFDFAIVNVVTLILGFLIFCTVMYWFTWRTPLPAAIRFAPLAACGGVILVLLALLQIDSTNGELIPTFRFRWVPARDATLKAAVAEVPPDIVDMKTVTADDFPQFLGPNRNVWIEGPELARDWRKQPPRELWRRPIGAGWSGFAVVNGYAVTLEQRGEEELVTCYKVDTGELCWANALTARHRTVFGGVGPRSTPTIDDGRVYALGATGVLRCLDGATGEMIWSDDILERFGSSPEQEGRVLAWGRSNSPLIVNDLVVLPAGGPPNGAFTSLVAYDKVAGDVVWKAGNEQISYSSPVLGSLAGVPQIVSVNEKNISGHSLEDGHVLWKEPWPGNSAANASVSQVHLLSGDRVLISKGYGEGLALIDVTLEDGQFKTKKRWWEKRLLKTKFTQLCVVGQYAYGLSDGILECVDLQEHRRQWKSGRYGHGQILGVGDLILVLGEEGDLMLIEATPTGRNELARLESAIEGKTWNNFALYGNRLVIRNAREAACYELPTVAPESANGQESGVASRAAQ